VHRDSVRHRVTPMVTRKRDWAGGMFLGQVYGLLEFAFDWVAILRTFPVYIWDSAQCIIDQS
jgi:hypothetical protein